MCNTNQFISIGIKHHDNQWLECVFKSEQASIDAIYDMYDPVMGQTTHMAMSHIEHMPKLAGSWQITIAHTHHFTRQQSTVSSQRSVVSKDVGSVASQRF